MFKSKNIITTIFKVPEVPKKIVVEEKVRVPEEPKLPPAKGTYLCQFATDIKPPFIHFQWRRQREISLFSMPQYN